MQAIALWLFWMVLGETVLTTVRNRVDRYWDKHDQSQAPDEPVPDKPEPYEPGDRNLRCALCEGGIRIVTAQERDTARALGWRVDPRDRFAFCPACLRPSQPPTPDPVLS